MAEIIQTATRFRYPISGDDLARIMAHEARHVGDGTLQRKLSEVPGVHEVTYNTHEGAGAVYFTVAASAPRNTQERVASVIDSHLKQLSRELVR